MALLGMRRERNSGQKATRSLLVLGLIGSLVACSNATNSDSSAATTDSSPGTAVDGADLAQPTCEQPGVLTCLLPWPDNRLTVPDFSTPTGRRLAIPSDATPINVDGVALDVTDQNRGDGFSPNSVIVFAAPDVDLVKSGVPNSTAIEDSLPNSII